MSLSKLENVSVDVKANVYFNGKVVSHSVYEKDGRKKTLGLIFPGTYSFNTGAPERMVMTSGKCRVKVKGEDSWKAYETGNEFSVPGNSAFEIAVEEGIAEYICIFE